jgi:lysosomal acid lipase/cholesteryl ester hydrolase
LVGSASPIVDLFYLLSRRIFNAVIPAAAGQAQRKYSKSAAIRDAGDFIDLCRLHGYQAEEHVVQTKDGYLLGLHRLAWRQGEEDLKVNAANPRGGLKKPVVYLHHGLLMNSEVWVCITDTEKCLAFHLVELGYDVWLGNNRGNKYSKKSIHHPPTSTAFWDFSMDEFAFHDIPDSIDYILSVTNQPTLSYVGFSQGTAQAFATLSIHPALNDKVNVFIALAPAMSPAGLNNGIVDSLMKASPSFLFLLFGRKSILSSTTLWSSIIYPPLFVRIIDISLVFLFGWTGANISQAQKLAAYPHLYSFTSTKSVVHWFQIIRNKAFQMYDDDVQTPMFLPLSAGSLTNRSTKVPRFPTRNIKTPIVLVYGGSDSLVDINVMLKELPRSAIATEIPHFEHLDFLWARDVDKLVFPHVEDALRSFSGREDHAEEYREYRVARSASLSDRSTPHVGFSMGSSYADVAAAGGAPDSDVTTDSSSSRSQFSRPAALDAKDTYADTVADTADLHGDPAPGELQPPNRFAARKGSAASQSSFSNVSLKGSLRSGKGLAIGAARPVASLNFDGADRPYLVGSDHESGREDGKVRVVRRKGSGGLG